MDEMIIKENDYGRDMIMDLIVMIALFAVSVFFILIAICQFSDGQIGSGLIYSLVSICSCIFVIMYKKGNITKL